MGGPGRKFYRLTDAGRAALAEEVADWRAFATALEGLLQAGPTEQVAVAHADPADPAARADREVAPEAEEHRRA